MVMDSADKLVLKAWGKRVRTARSKLELTQIAAAQRIGIDQSTLSRIETGDYRQMTPVIILRLCLGLCMEPEDFAWPPAIKDIAAMREQTTEQVA